MRLGEFLSAARPIPHKPVKFRAIGKSPSGGPVASDVDAVFVFVDETERARARVDAIAELKKDFKDADYPPSVLSDEITYHFLYRALRDGGDAEYRVMFAENVRALKNALVAREAARLDEMYNEWVEQEFPEDVSDEDMAKMTEDAKLRFFGDLLSAYGYSRIRRALPSLAKVFG